MNSWMIYTRELHRIIQNSENNRTIKDNRAVLRNIIAHIYRQYVSRSEATFNYEISSVCIIIVLKFGIFEGLT